MMEGGPGADLEVVEAELFFDLLVGLLSRPPRPGQRFRSQDINCYCDVQ